VFCARPSCSGMVQAAGLGIALPHWGGRVVLVILPSGFRGSDGSLGSQAMARSSWRMGVERGRHADYLDYSCTALPAERG